MKQIDMSAAAVTSRLKLVSELRRFSLKLGNAKIRPRLDRKVENDREREDKRHKPGE